MVLPEKTGVVNLFVQPLRGCGYIYVLITPDFVRRYEIQSLRDCGDFLRRLASIVADLAS